MRGQKSKPGDTRVAPNGYHYTRTKEGWELTHRLMAEQELGRPLEYDERVSFKDKNRTNLTSNNLEVRKARSRTKEHRKARLEARIDELQAQLNELEQTS